MYKTAIIFVLFYLISLFSIGQVTESGRQHINKLSSDKFSGRGYVNNGMLNSARYIKKHLKKAKIKPASNSYFLYTPTFSVNTFPNKLKFEESTAHEARNSYEAGIDYLVHPSSGDIQLENIPLIRLHGALDSVTLQSKKAYYLDKSKVHKDRLAALEERILGNTSIENSLLIIYDSIKLSWYPSMTKSANAIVYINKPLSGDRISAYWKTNFKPKFEGINIIGKVAGERADSSVFFTAHYDHLGMLGKHIFPGANDNASGVALLLDMANYYAANKPKYDTYFLFTCGEELGLLGSYFFINNSIYPLNRIKLLVNLDMVGTGDEGITIVNAIKQKRFFDLMVSTNNDRIVAIKSRGEACNSDHCLFDRAGVPSVFIYTLGGKQAYHDIDDNGEGLSLYAYEALYNLLIEVINQY